MAKYGQMNDLFQETAAKVTGSVEEWLRFCKTASNVYRYPFSDQLMIYAQRPDAKQCAPMDYWNKNLRCYVNKGAKGIALLDRESRGGRLRYVFDMSDVHKVSDKSIMPYQWELQDGAKYLVANELERKYMNTEIPYESMEFEDRIIQIADTLASDNLADFRDNIASTLGDSALSEIYEDNIDEILHETLSASVASMLLTRCGADVSEYEDRLTGLQYISMFDTLGTISELGTLTANITRPVLIDIEKEVRRYERMFPAPQVDNAINEEHNQNKDTEERSAEDGNSVRTERGLSDTDAESERSTGRSGADREVRSASGEIPERTQGGDLRSVSDVGQSDGVPADNRQTGIRDERTDNSSDDESRGSGFGSSDERLDGVRTENDKDRSGSGADSHEGSDLRLSEEEPKYEQLSLFPTETEQVESIEAAENEVTAAFSLDEIRADIERAVRNHDTIYVAKAETAQNDDMFYPVADSRTPELFFNERIEYVEDQGTMLLMGDTEAGKDWGLYAFRKTDEKPEKAAKDICDYLESHQMTVTGIVAAEDLEKQPDRTKALSVGDIVELPPTSMVDMNGTAEEKFSEPEQGIFRIYQMKDGDEYHGVHFMDKDFIDSEGIKLNKEDYNLVYEGDLSEIPGFDDAERLQNIFDRFGNSPFEERPADFKGYSISVSDVITFDKGSGEEPHFVDSFGFKDFPAFLQEKENVKEVQNEEVPFPNVLVEWSESSLFEGGKTYTVAEYDKLLHDADLSRYAKAQELIEKYGSFSAWLESDDQTELAGYDKTKVTVTFKDGTEFIDRHDIGDGIGGLLEHIALYPELADKMPELREAAGREEDKTPYQLVIHYKQDTYRQGHYESKLSYRTEEEAIRTGKEFIKPHSMVYDGFGVYNLESGEVVRSVGKFEPDIPVNDGILGEEFKEKYAAVLENDAAEKPSADQFRDDADLLSLTVGDHLVDDKGILWTVTSTGFMLSLEKAEENKVDTLVANKSFIGWESRIENTGRLDDFEQYRRITVEEYLAEQGFEKMPGKMPGILEEDISEIDTAELEEQIGLLKDENVGYRSLMSRDDIPASEKVEYQSKLTANLNEIERLGGIVANERIRISEQADIAPEAVRETEINANELSGTEYIAQLPGEMQEKIKSAISSIENSDVDTAMAGRLTDLEDNINWREVLNADLGEKEASENKAGNFHITDNDLGKGDPKEKYRRNVEAIKTLKKLEEEGRAATPEEQEILSQYIGWGGLADAFDERKPYWYNEVRELKGILTEDEYKAAKASVTDSFYTSPEVIDGIYGTLERMGFEKGNILEPSMGVGNFFGKLPDKMQGSKLYGVELDSISGRIAKQLYPDANIQVTGYQNTNFSNNSFDVAVGNVPFGTVSPFDKEYSKLKFMLHDYFFAKTLDKVRPGGIVAFVTSKGTMDKENPRVRKYIAERAEFLGAIRLPGGRNGAFKENAGTEVTSDIIFLQKRDGIADVEPDWVHLGKDANGITMNSYFAEHPEQIVGHMEMVSGRFGMESACVADTERPFNEQYARALSGITGRYSAAEKADILQEQEGTLLPSPDDKNFSYVVRDDKLYYRENTVLVPQQLKGDREARIKGMVEIRDLTRKVLDMQLTDASDSEIAALQLKLSDTYDAFVKKYGRIDKDNNKKAFSKDDSYSLIRALEIYDNETGEFKGKADIFTKRTIQRAEAITSVETASEALNVCLNEKGSVDIGFMSKLCHKPEKEVIEDLQGIIFKNPLTDRFETSDEYLSGNVRKKLATARNYAEQNPEFLPNVAALEAIQPEELSAGDINVRLGATWIDPEYINEFMTEVLGTSSYDIRDNRIACKYTDVTAEWYIEGKSRDHWNVKVNEVYGTSRRNAYTLLEDALNLRTTTVCDTVIDENGKKKSIPNKKETILAQQKQDMLKEAFNNWIFEDPERRETLVRKYNEMFNSTRPRQFNGGYITLPGSNPNITLRPHQKDSVARIITGDNTLLAHSVGAGKTFTMVAGAMESKRLGLCNKSMFVVPNHLTEQWGSDFRQLYPNANILVATKKDFEPRNRKKFISRIATGDYDAVIIGHTQFEKIPVSKEREAAFIQSEIDEALEARDALRAETGKDNKHSIKDIEIFIKGKEADLDKALHSKVKDDVVTFEQLGVDRLFVDESHNFKNLKMATKMSRVAGVQTSNAGKSTDMLMKCRYIDEITGGKGITFATGTPISNSMTELYTNMRYLQQSKLKEMNLNHFDKWASTFGETITAMEVAPEGQTYRSKTRFAKFYNLPELMSIFKEAADVRTPDMLKLPVPEAEFIDVVLEKSPEQEAILESIGKRADQIRGGNVDTKVDNMLKITNDGRKMALDQRLYSDALPDNPNSKAAACAENVSKIYRDTMEQKSAQLIFCDLGTPGAKDEGKFSVYDDIKQKLIEKGIPAEEIAFIHDADKGSNPEKKKEELFAKVRSGKVRVLIGSTAKMGAGTNVQTKLIALHHMDVPWRPAEEGHTQRYIRQKPSKINKYRAMQQPTITCRYHVGWLFFILTISVYTIMIDNVILYT